MHLERAQKSTIESQIERQKYFSRSVTIIEKCNEDNCLVFLSINENLLVNKGYLQLTSSDCEKLLVAKSDKYWFSQVLKTILKVYLHKVSAKLNALAIFSS